MFRTLTTLATFTLIGGLLYKYNEEIFGELKKFNGNTDHKPANLPKASTAESYNKAQPVSNTNRA